MKKGIKQRQADEKVAKRSGRKFTLYVQKPPRMRKIEEEEKNISGKV